RGFEPPTSWSRTKRSSQAEPRPDDKPKQCSTRHHAGGAVARLSGRVVPFGPLVVCRFRPQIHITKRAKRNIKAERRLIRGLWRIFVRARKRFGALLPACFLSVLSRQDAYSSRM